MTWFNINPSSGQGSAKVDVSADPNYGLQRSASVSFNFTGGKAKTLSISQPGMLSIIADIPATGNVSEVLIQDDTLYDNFTIIQRFDIGLAASGTKTQRVVALTDYFNADNTICYSKKVTGSKYGMAADFRFSATRKIQNKLKYISLTITTA